MATNSTLLQAILAMDAYNQGYDKGVLGVGNQIGEATISAERGQADAQAAGFYAAAYTVGSQTIISYRGTDANFVNPLGDTGSDLVNGYGLAVGSGVSAQSQLAIEFYKSVAGGDANVLTANIALTGHSLGGGLAGLVGALYGRTGTLFDNIMFEAGSVDAFDRSIDKEQIFQPDPDGAPITYTGPTNPALRALIYGGAVSVSGLDVVGGATPWAVDRSHLNAVFVEGEFISTVRGQQTPTEMLAVPTEVNLPGPDSGLLSFSRHSMSLLVLLEYAKVAQVSNDWLQATKFVLPVLYSDDVAQAAGADPFKGTSPLNEVMRSAIAYSAVDEGSAGLPFGDKAIRGLFDDANDLGRVFSASGANSIFADGNPENNTPTFEAMAAFANDNTPLTRARAG